MPFEIREAFQITWSITTDPEGTITWDSKIFFDSPPPARRPGKGSRKPLDDDMWFFQLRVSERSL